MIYFAQTDDNRFIKIGYAAEVKKRVDNLRTASPHELKLLASMPGDLALEKQIHARFSYLRVNREWFNTDQEIVKLAVSASRLTGISGDADPFLRYAIFEPKLIDLLIEAASAVPDSDGYFCANEFFFRYRNPRNSLKARLTRLVGWEAEGYRPELKTEAAYDVVYERIYEALPNCHHCACVGGMDN